MGMEKEEKKTKSDYSSRKAAVLGFAYGVLHPRAALLFPGSLQEALETVRVKIMTKGENRA